MKSPSFMLQSPETPMKPHHVKPYICQLNPLQCPLNHHKPLYRLYQLSNIFPKSQKKSQWIQYEPLIKLPWNHHSWVPFFSPFSTVQIGPYMSSVAVVGGGMAGVAAARVLCQRGRAFRGGDGTFCGWDTRQSTRQANSHSHSIHIFFHFILYINIIDSNSFRWFQVNSPTRQPNTLMLFEDIWCELYIMLAPPFTTGQENLGVHPKKLVKIVYPNHWTVNTKNGLKYVVAPQVFNLNPFPFEYC